MNLLILRLVGSFISLEDSSQGQAAEVIRSYYWEFHIPLPLVDHHIGFNSYWLDPADSLIYLAISEQDKVYFCDVDYFDEDNELKDILLIERFKATSICFNERHSF